MSFVRTNTDNPLGQRPFQLMARQQGMGWMGQAGVAQSMPGSMLQYQATWANIIESTPASMIAYLQNNLAAHGMSVASSATTSQGLLSAPAITVMVYDTVGHNLVSDAKSVLDALIQQNGGTDLISSMSLAAGPGQSTPVTPAAGPGSPSDFTTWVENNAVYIGAGLLAMVLLPALVKKI